MKRLRTEAVVHLDRLKRNLNRAKDRLPKGCDMIMVVKGDAYGHGIEGTYKIFKEFGIKKYAVSCWEEAKALRKAGAKKESILILGDTIEDQHDKLIKYNITQTIFDVEVARHLNKKAKKANVIAPIHIKLDTGMSRLGFPADERAIAPVKEIAAMKNLKITGCFTHFMCADELDNPKTDIQLKAFLDTVKMLRDAGVDIPFIHTSNSPALMLRPETYLDSVRSGDAIFGLCPIDRDAWEKSGVEEVMTWNTYIAMLKTIPAGTQVGYGATYTAEHDIKIATIPVGFADGYSRHLSNKGYVSIRGKLAPIVGRVCMDQFMVDVTAIDGVQRGDEVELLGKNFGILDMAEMLDDNVDEIVCRISKRVPRVYTE